MKTLTVAFIGIMLATLSCTKPELIKREYTDDEVKTFIISDQNFSKSLSSLNQLNQLIKSKNSQFSPDSKREIIATLKISMGNSERFFLPGKSRGNDPRQVAKIRDFYGADFETKMKVVRETTMLFLSNLFEKGVSHIQARKVLESFIDNAENIKFARTDDYQACVNIAYYCYNLALNECFISDSADPPMLNLCLDIAELGLTVDLIKCEVAYY